jgi:hypothetical protein
VLAHGTVSRPRFCGRRVSGKQYLSVSRPRPSHRLNSFRIGGGIIEPKIALRASGASAYENAVQATTAEVRMSPDGEWYVDTARTASAHKELRYILIGSDGIEPISA